MVMKMGRFGKFLACSAFPKCRNTKRIETPGSASTPPSDTGIVCPKCGKGNIARRRSKRGRFFFGCTAYPNCDFVLWNPPAVDEADKLKTCEKCQSPMVMGAKDTVKCSNKVCIGAKAKLTPDTHSSS
jgi:DNA topoisomerase-1